MAANKGSMFRFKEFVIRQDQTAMKVCTDACILGAYAEVAHAQRILDIGTGTGLLALMTAQRAPLAQVTAVEIEEKAFFQAKENIAQSPFSERVTVKNIRIQDFTLGDMPRFDCIISNPPFFQNHLKSPDLQRTQALHTDTLPFGDLIKAVDQLLDTSGCFWLLLPPYEMQIFGEMAQEVGLFQNRRLQIYSSPNKGVFREIGAFSRIDSPTFQDILKIKDSDNEYTLSFKKYLNPYYLIF
jgi:tRNA1Val (adenine37-N6)-methyltransferase